MKPYEMILEIEKEQMKILAANMTAENAAESIELIRRHCNIIEQAEGITYCSMDNEAFLNNASISAGIISAKKRREADLSFAECKFAVVGLEQSMLKEQIIYELTRRGADVMYLTDLNHEEELLNAIRQSELVVLFTNYLDTGKVARVKELCRTEGKLVYTTKQQNIQPLIVGVKNKLKNASTFK